MNKGQEYQSEVNYLNETIENIEKIILENETKIKENEKDSLEMKEYIWKNISSMDSAEISFYNNLFNVNYNISEINYFKNKVLKEMVNNPYYGRVDFAEDGQDFKIKVYIGLTNVMDKELKIYVYDWRSPIACLYYEYEDGKCVYKSPRGNVKGNIELKRQYKILDGKLIYYIDSSLSISDELLKDALSSNSSENMKQIVSTIQKEQDRVIRNSQDKVLIVSGPAGCGKTSVALHHVAFLLYKNRETMKSDDVLIFSPNEIFSKYISEVLPSLGEKNVLQTEFSKYISSYLNEYKKIEKYEKFIERTYNATREEQENIKTKLSKEIIEYIDNYVTTLAQKVEFKDIIVDDIIIFTAKECKDIMDNDMKKWPLTKRINKTIDYIYMKIRHIINKKMNKNEIMEYLKSRVNFAFNIKEIALSFSEYYNKCREKNDLHFELDGNELRYEDAIVLLYLKGKINGFGYDNKIQQVVIDEAQDYTYVQLLALKEIFKQAAFTILGDQNQTLNTYASTNFVEDSKMIFGEYNKKIIELKTTYRSSYEITNYCNSILDLKNINPIKRNTREPIEINFSNKKAAINWLKEYLKEEKKYNFNKIAIIVSDIQKSKFLKTALKNYIMDNVQILPIYLAKGLEFDSVVVISEKDINKNIKYIACSRALHHLAVINF